jgi:uncharacterized protein YkwD
MLRIRYYGRQWSPTQPSRTRLPADDCFAQRSAVAMKLFRVLCVVLVPAFLLVGCLPSGTEASIQETTNSYRTSIGVQTEAWSTNLAGSAHAQAVQVAAAGALAHSDLQALLDSLPGMTMCGENVGVGPASMSGQAMTDTWRASPAHDANLRFPGFTVTGTSVVIGADGRAWYVAQYCG